MNAIFWIIIIVVLPILIPYSFSLYFRKEGRRLSKAVNESPTPNAVLESAVYWRPRKKWGRFHAGRAAITADRFVLSNSQGEIASLPLDEIHALYQSNCIDVKFQNSEEGYLFNLFSGKIRWWLKPLRINKLYIQWCDTINKA